MTTQRQKDINKSIQERYNEVATRKELPQVDLSTEDPHKVTWRGKLEQPQQQVTK